MVMLRRRMTAWLRQFPADIWLLGLGSFVNIAGLSLLWPINAIYIHTQLDQSMTVAGLVLMLFSGAGFIGSFVSGWLYDKIGIVPVLLIGLGAAGVLITVPIFNHAFSVYVVVMGLFGLASSMPFPALTTMAGQAWPDGGRRPFNFIYVTNNLGVATGTAVGGLLAQHSFRIVFSGIMLAYIIFLLLVITVFKSRFQRYRLPKEDVQTPVSLPLHVFPQVPWLAVGVLLGGFVLSWVVYVQWQSTLSVYMQQLGYPLTMYSVLWTLNGILIFAAQPLVSFVAKRIHQLPLQMMIGVFLFSMSFLILIWNDKYVGFVAAMVVTTFGEMFVWPSIPAAIAQLAPSHRAGMLQGLVGSSATLGRMFGPVIGGFLYDRVAEPVSLAVFCGGLAFPLLLFLLYHRLDQTADRPTNLSL
ncbi:MFS transporter [Alicyclobacillus sp. SO9]|uniref:MDR family MFS transporter n=1 Tax=Alicyclobacillus sp. SO9 TaxID=2665646 RepID=UPI0018E6DC6F|nr:MFS transporter [Alicyclobacillus sp. SO9]QQE77784.1 MFS transporter [Alicyclobacillus sp. SO9]